MKTAEYRAHIHKLDQAALEVELKKIEQEWFNLKFNVRAGQAKGNTSYVSRLRRRVALIKTVMHARARDIGKRN